MFSIESKQPGFRRCGIAHPEEATGYPDDHFTDEQMDILVSEPMLRVSHSVDNTNVTLAEAIKQLDVMDATLWTGDGKPRTEALSEVMGVPVTAKERNDKWERHQQDNE